jgi:predicted SAM-dependent methyltransferase
MALSVFPSHVWESVRNEWPLTKLRWRNSLLPSRRRRMRELRTLQDIRLHVGCGKRVVDGWTNIDCFAADGIAFECDFREPLPFGDCSARLIYTEHVIEHVHFHQAQFLLAELFRVLRPGGTVRIGCPDAAIYARAYVNEDRAFFELAKNIGGPASPLDTPIKVINQMCRMGGSHLYAWDYETLKLEMERAGFTGVVLADAGSSVHEGLCLDDPSHAFETLYVEAGKTSTRAGK